MKLNRILPVIIVLILSSASLGYAQKAYKWMKKKCPAVTITKPGDLYSSYNITEADIKLIKENGKLKQQHVDEILANCTEKSWTGGMSSFDTRVDNKDIIEKFKAFQVVVFGSKRILIIPADLNQGLPKDFSQKKDIFLVMGL